MDFDMEYFEYKIPSNILTKFTDEFLDIFADQLIQVFLAEDKLLKIGELLWITGTTGWCNAFTETCKAFDMTDVLKYYEGLKWYDSDNFDDELCCLLLKRRMKL